MNNIFEILPSDYHSKLTCDRANILSPDSWLSKSVIWELAKSSLYKWRHYPKKYKQTDSMRWGSLVDCLTTTHELFQKTYRVRPETYIGKESTKKGAKEIEKPWNANANVCKAWLAENEDKEIISREELIEAKKAAGVLLVRHKESASIFEKSKTQGVIAGKILGVQMKGLVDLAPIGEPYLADLKTTADFNLEGFAKTVAKFGYHMQGGLYLALWNAMYPDDQRDSFRIVWQDSSSPYEVAITELSKADLDAGYNYAVHLIQRIIKATELNSWPMYLEGATPLLSRPTWASMQEEEKIETAPEITAREESII